MNLAAMQAALSKIPLIGIFLGGLSKGAIQTIGVMFFVPIAAVFQAWLLLGPRETTTDPVVVPVLNIKQSTVVLGLLALAVAGLAAAAARRG